MKFALATGVALLSLATAAQAYEAYVNQPAPILTGPSPDYPPVVYLRGGETVEVYGCLDDYDWCDIQFLNYRGWFDAEQLSSIYDGRRVPLYDYGSDIGLPIISFSFNDYWGRYYRDRPFFRERERWERIGPPQPRDDHRRFEGRPDFNRGGDFQRDRGQGRPDMNRGPDFNRGQPFDQQRFQQEQQQRLQQQQMQQRGAQDQQRMQQEQIQQRGAQDQQRLQQQQQMQQRGAQDQQRMQQQQQMQQRGQQEQQRMQQQQMQQRAPQSPAPGPQGPPPQQPPRPQPAPQAAPAAQPQHVQGTGEHQRYVGPGDRQDNR